MADVGTIDTRNTTPHCTAPHQNHTEPATAADEKLEAPHPNDQLAVVPKPLRGMVGSSLWDALGAHGVGAAGAAGDAISMKQQQGRRSEVRRLKSS